MFSHKNRENLQAELKDMIKRYYPDSPSCYRNALFNFVFHACELFDVYQNLFNRPRDRSACADSAEQVSAATRAGQKALAELVRSPPIGLKTRAEPDPPPTARSETNRHREPPPPPR